MKLLIDNADITSIQKIAEFYPIDGVTTNPTILAKAARPPYEVLEEIRRFIGEGAQLHVQAVSRSAEGMAAEGRCIVRRLGRGTFVKIPSVPEGFKAMKMLSAEGIHVTATAVYTPMQAFLAAKSGAEYAAPYVNRIDNMGYNGVQVAKDIHDIFRNNGLHAEVLAASFKNSQQLLELCKYGVGASTAGPDILEGLVKNPAITSAVEAFIHDFEALTAPGRTMAEG